MASTIWMHVLTVLRDFPKMQNGQLKNGQHIYQFYNRVKHWECIYVYLLSMQMTNEILRDALLKRYQLTEEGFRQKSWCNFVMVKKKM